MKILFSTFFDYGYYLDYSKPENKFVFNVKIAGPKGLLEILERMTGTTGNYMNNLQRKMAYHEILSDFDARDTMIFSDSFKNDPVGVSGELLRYRDQLIFIGWGKDSPDISAKIDLLRDVEKQAVVPPGIEDRYRKVLDVLLKNNSGLDFSEIEIFENREDLHPFYQKIFSVFSEKGIKVKYNELPIENVEGHPLGELINGLLSKDKQISLDENMKEKFQLLSFKSDIEAAHFFASQELSSQGTLIINSDNPVFDGVIKTFGKPLSGSVQHNANTLVIQLFKLSASLFTSPLHIINYMAYLQAPVHPAPRSLRNGFLKEIVSTGGVDIEKFQQKITDFEYGDKKEKEQFSFFILPQDQKNKLITLELLKKFYTSLSGWAIKKAFSADDLSEEIKKQHQHLKALCDLLLKAFDSHGGNEISQEEFLRLINDIYEPAEVKIEYEEAYSVNVLSSPGQIINNTEQTIWLDFYNNEISPTWYDFLSGDEIKKLEGFNIKLWKSSAQASSIINSCLMGVIRCREKLCLVISEKAGDKLCSEHPLHSLLKAKISNISDFLIPVSMPEYCDIPGWKKPIFIEADKISLPKKELVHNLESGNLIKARNTESYSSSELLINYPFDWVFQYPLQVKPGFTYELYDVETTMGNVGHHFINELFVSCVFDFERIFNRLSINYDSDLQNSINRFGAVLLLDENRFDLARLKDQLKKSVQVLLEIIRNNDLKIIGSEQSETQKLPGQGGHEYTGNVDLLLETKNGNKVIFDLKWTRKLSKYFEKLREGQAVQLALYNELIGTAMKCRVEKTAFYLLSDAKLLSIYDFTGSDVIKINTENTDRLVSEKVLNSMKFRKEQLAAGLLEDGEEELLEDLQYFTEPGYETRIGLTVDDKGKQKKNYYSKFKVFKGYYK